jgi:uncharacterized delta-60 repeat protein
MDERRMSQHCTYLTTLAMLLVGLIASPAQANGFVLLPVQVHGAAQDALLINPSGLMYAGCVPIVVNSAGNQVSQQFSYPILSCGYASTATLSDVIYSASFSPCCEHRPYMSVGVSTPTGQHINTYYGTEYINLHAMAAQADGKILYDGDIYFWEPLWLPPHRDNWNYGRIQPDLSIWHASPFDYALGHDGTFDSPYVDQGSDEDEYVSRFMPLPNGLLFISGQSKVGPGALDYDTVVMLVDGNGKLVPSFGTNSRVRFPGLNVKVSADKTGRLYVNTQGNELIRLNTDGTPDTTFTGPTWAIGTAVGNIDIDSAGRVVVFGVETDSSGRLTGFVARLTPNGILDSSFAGTGKLTATASEGVSETSSTGRVGAGDKPVLLVNVHTKDSDGTDTTLVALLRFNTDGTPDTTFGAIERDPNGYPDPFTFPSKARIPYNALNVASEPATITGITGAVSVKVTPDSVGDFSIGCTGVYATTGKIGPNQTICARHNAATSQGVVVETRIDIGGRIGGFASWTADFPVNTTLPPFSFKARSDVPVSTMIQSEKVYIPLDITSPLPVTVAGGEYSMSCVEDQFTSAPGTIKPGDSICVRHMSASQNSQSVNTKLVIGGVEGTFTSTTVAAPPTTPNPPANNQSGGGGGALDWFSVLGLTWFARRALRRGGRSEPSG